VGGLQQDCELNCILPEPASLGTREIAFTRLICFALTFIEGSLLGSETGSNPWAQGKSGVKGYSEK
jgi:hypothetical protein